MGIDQIKHTFALVFDGAAVAVAIVLMAGVIARMAVYTWKDLVKLVRKDD